ncbi:hypothetical protein SSTG_01826 [Streptomyces sp. e14]|nr:hypothetical protein SSTG_01826 [Streptomyces sp. e14]
MLVDAGGRCVPPSARAVTLLPLRAVVLPSVRAVVLPSVRVRGPCPRGAGGAVLVLVRAGGDAPAPAGGGAPVRPGARPRSPGAPHPRTLVP